MSQVSEETLERMRELANSLPSDSLAQREWAQRAKHALLLLVEDAQDRFLASGGEFALRLREALEPKILREVNGRVELTPITTEHSLSVHVTREAVWVDVRLRLGVGS